MKKRKRDRKFREEKKASRQTGRKTKSCTDRLTYR
jgi:hypothetical protein